jgi:hypothetical protein
MTRKPLRPITASVLLVLGLALAACESSGMATSAQFGDNNSNFGHSSASSDEYGTPSTNDE